MLEKLLGTEGQQASQAAQTIDGHNGAEEDIDEGEIDFEGLSLKELAVRKSSHAKDENVYTSQTVEECMFCFQEYV